MSKFNSTHATSFSGPPIYYAALGVFKIDYRSAGYSELVRVAKEWSKDDNFYQLIVRKVSSENYGIDFVYLSTDPKGTRIQKYQQDLKDRYGGGLYAIDYNESSGEDIRDKLADMIVVSKPIEIQ